jgi:hypothetical protein
LARAPVSVTTQGVDSLGRVTDPSALEACARARARLRVEVPAAWLEEGAAIELTAPARLCCARCDGGGCDGCGRSGVLRAPAEEGDRRIEALVPALAGRAGVALRIPEPFGPEHPIAQIVLEICAAEGASAGVRRMAAAPLPAPTAAALSPGISPWAWAVALVVVAILAALGSR